MAQPSNLSLLSAASFQLVLWIKPPLISLFALRKGEKGHGGLTGRPEFSPGLSGTALPPSQAKPWVLVSPKRSRPEGPQESSVPHVPFVEVDFVTFQETAELILEAHPFVMLGLRADVLSHLTHSGLTYRESSESILPVKLGI